LISQNNDTINPFLSPSHPLYYNIIILITKIIFLITI
jgi:hypothetical protein